MQYRLRPGQSNFIYNGETIRRNEDYPRDHPCVRKMPERFCIYRDTEVEEQPEPDSGEDIEYAADILDAFSALLETPEKPEDPEE